MVELLILKTHIVFYDYFIFYFSTLVYLVNISPYFALFLHAKYIAHILFMRKRLDGRLTLI